MRCHGVHRCTCACGRAGRVGGSSAGDLLRSGARQACLPLCLTSQCHLTPSGAGVGFIKRRRALRVRLKMSDFQPASKTGAGQHNMNGV